MMRTTLLRLATSVTVALALPCAISSVAVAQREPGHPIGKVTVIGNLIHLELDTGVVSPEHLFDLDHRTLRFTPTRSGYRIENIPLRWDADFGPKLEGTSDTLRSFTFPFSGKEWSTLNIAIGAITFGAMQNSVARPGGPPVGNRTGAGGSMRNGFQMDRYASLETVGETFINMIPGIAAFVKSGLNGPHYAKELSDRVVVTWTLSEGSGGIQAFTWTPTVNRIQATLYKSGVIELSYNDVSARDAVVGVFPMVTGGVEKPLATISAPTDTTIAPNLDVRRITLAAIDGLFLKATIETRGAVLPNGDPSIDGVTYRVAFDRSKRANAALDKAAVVWTVRGIASRRAGGAARYIVSGDGVAPDVTVRGNTISISGILPHALSGAAHIYVSADVAEGSPSSIVDRVPARSVALTGIRSSGNRSVGCKEQLRLVPGRVRGIPLGQHTASAGCRLLGDHCTRRQVRLHRDVFGLPRGQS